MNKECEWAIVCAAKAMGVPASKCFSKGGKGNAVRAAENIAVWLLRYAANLSVYEIMSHLQISYAWVYQCLKNAQKSKHMQIMKTAIALFEGRISIYE